MYVWTREDGTDRGLKKCTLHPDAMMKTKRTWAEYLACMGNLRSSCSLFG
jgi:hypothetical protein